MLWQLASFVCACWPVPLTSACPARSLSGQLEALRQQAAATRAELEQQLQASQAAEQRLQRQLSSEQAQVGVSPAEVWGFC